MTQMIDVSNRKIMVYIKSKKANHNFILRKLKNKNIFYFLILLSAETFNMKISIIICLIAISFIVNIYYDLILNTLFFLNIFKI